MRTLLVYTNSQKATNRLFDLPYAQLPGLRVFQDQATGSLVIASGRDACRQDVNRATASKPARRPVPLQRFAADVLR